MAEQVGNQSIKQDSGKPRWSLLLGSCRRALLEVVKVREYGNQKYADSGSPDSWRRVDPARYLDAAARHLVAVMNGERANPDDGGVNHLAQAVIDLLFVLEIEADRAVEADERADAQKAIAEALTRGDALQGRVYGDGECIAFDAPAVEPKRFLWREDGSHLELGLGCPIPPVGEIIAILDRIKRWNGHTDKALSVLAHSVLVHDIVCEQWRRDHGYGAPPSLRRRALLHDAAEALYGDRSTPVKQIEREMLGAGARDVYAELTRDFDERLAAREGFDDPSRLVASCIKRADRVSVCLETMTRGINEAECRRYYGDPVVDDALCVRFTGLPIAVDARNSSAIEMWCERWRNAGGSSL